MTTSYATAALYYANRLIEAGCEPQLLARRTIAHASEDYCSAKALNTACNALYALNNLGMPEGNIILSHAIERKTVNTNQNIGEKKSKKSLIMFL